MARVGHWRWRVVLVVLAMPFVSSSMASSRPKRGASACTDREPCQKSCAAGDLDACFAFGQQLLVKSKTGSAARDPLAASRVFLAACEKGHAGACLELARLRTHGLGGPIDLEAAAAAAREACNRGLEPACATVALNALFAAGQRRDSGLAHVLAKEAEAATRRGCAAKDGMLCALLAELTDAGLVPGGPAAARASNDQARALLEPRCARDDGIACLWLSKGESPAATTTLRHACELGVTRACTGLGSRLLYGTGVDRDTTQGIAAWKTACAGNDQWACTALCARYGSGQSPTKDASAARPFCERAIALYTRSCDLGSGEGCATLARFYEDGVSVPVDQTRATALYSSSVEPLRSECAGHHSSACALLIGLYRHGPGVAKDLSAMLEAERLSCVSGAASACLLYAERLRTGDLVERSNERAKFYDELACELGNTAGCTAAASSPTIAQKHSSPPAACPPDERAEEDSPNHCCFPGQVWSDKERRCAGDPRCPQGTVLEKGTCLGDPEPKEAESAPPAPESASSAEKVAVAAEPLRQTRVEQPVTSAPPTPSAAVGNDCSDCAGACASLSARCQTSMPACYEASACLCRCQRDRGGCGMSLALLDQCAADNAAQASRLSGGGKGERVK